MPNVRSREALACRNARRVRSPEALARRNLRRTQRWQAQRIAEMNGYKPRPRLPSDPAERKKHIEAKKRAARARRRAERARRASAPGPIYKSFF
jgi:hypothetical protein